MKNNPFPLQKYSSVRLHHCFCIQCSLLPSHLPPLFLLLTEIRPVLCLMVISRVGSTEWSGWWGSGFGSLIARLGWFAFVRQAGCLIRLNFLHLPGEVLNLMASWVTIDSGATSRCCMDYLFLLPVGQFLKSRVVSTVENTKVFNVTLLSLLLLRTRLPPPSLMLDGCPVFHSLLCYVFPHCMRLSEDLIVMFRDTRCPY